MLRAGLLNKSITRCASTSATTTLSKATIVDLPLRWESMPSTERENIVSKLQERQKLPWTELSDIEKKAVWYISYGEWGPRRPVHAKGDASFIAKGVVVGLLGSLGLFGFVRAFAQEPPKTMTKEWQLQSDEYLKSKNANPWSGYSQVQSK